jgi:hypothetical protein
MTFHCRSVTRERGAAVPCSRNAIIVWRDKDGVAHGFCEDHLAEGQVQAIKHDWLVSESVLEGKVA